MISRFRERYHPTESMKFRSQIYERKQQSAKTFMEYLYDKKFDTVLFDETSDHLKINSTNQKPEGHEDFMEYRYVGLEIPKSPCLFVNGINDTVKRADLDKVSLY